MATPFDLWRSVVEVAEGDGTTAGTGLVGLTSKTNPLRKHGDRGANTSRPIVTGLFPDSDIRRGTKDGLVVTTQFNCLVENDSTGRAEAMAARLEVIMTHSNLNSTARTTPVDALPYFRGMRELTEQDEGRRTVVVEMDTWFNR